MKKFKLAVVMGRFQPFHNGHKRLIEFAMDQADEVLVLVGSVNKARSIKNPFFYNEVYEMIRGCFKDKPVRIRGMIDTPTQAEWLSEVNGIVDSYDHRPSEVCVVGYEKDSSSYYLKDFPRYTLIEAPQMGQIDATHVRELWFEDKHFENLVPHSTIDVMNGITRFGGVRFKTLCDDYWHIKEYKALFKYHKFPPVFVTTDAVVYCKGHTLMIKRGGSPGKGQWALPGGFIDQGETIKEGIFRELREETKIDVPPGKLKNSLRDIKVFDAPDRSLRGRTITHAGLIVLDEPRLPKVRGEDDAVEAKWVPNSELASMEDRIFEDHYDIITTMIRQVQ